MPSVIRVNFAGNTNGEPGATTVPATPGGGPAYELKFFNNSASTQTFVCFQSSQSPPSGLVPAWFVMRVGPRTELIFSWQPTYDFVWMESGTLAPGITFTAVELLPATLQASSLVTLTYGSGAFGFIDQRQGRSDSLMITCDGTIPMDTASVGIGMAGSATEVMQAAPNMTFTFTSTARYWMTLTDVVQGEIFDPSKLAVVVPLVFEPNVCALTVTLNPDGTVTVQDGAAA
ncbi:hypothetical protein A4A58_28625 [Tardiphaga robiniae]|uniref:Protein rhiA n=1 Tax=Tardiphaga robiniae TaxID=943830 RepID=A0A161R1U2_9BRAD|nr:hypothetical protein A4A58_28625 [Tardiphaga robiniae]